MKGSRIIATGALLLAMAVALGAFGAHAMRERLDAERLANWRTGVDYHFIHALGLLLIGVLEPRIGSKAASRSAWLLVAGIILFSGSLYLLSAKDLLGMAGAAPILGPLTPLGGLCFLAAWVLLFINALRQHDRG